MKYKTVKIEERTYNLIKEIAKKKNLPISRIIEQSVLFYESFHNSSRKREQLFKNNEDIIEKLSWKIFKFIKSIGHYYENTKNYNLQLLQERIKELEEFLQNLEIENKVEILRILQSIKRLAKMLLNEKKKEYIIELNQNAKLLLKLLFLSL
jgi:hypothetical protein